MGKKMCEICGLNPATVPDREQIERPVNRVCSSCHSTRLRADMRCIINLKKKRSPASSEGEVRGKNCFSCGLHLKSSKYCQKCGSSYSQWRPKAEGEGET